MKEVVARDGIVAIVILGGVRVRHLQINIVAMMLKRTMAITMKK